jgi:hypothetical protein
MDDQPHIPNQWYQVFQPGAFPIYNYVKRHAQIDTIRNFVEYGAKHILAVTGLSGTGKTVLVKDVILNNINEAADPRSDWDLVVLESVWFNDSRDGFQKQLCAALNLLPAENVSKRELSFLGKFIGYNRGSTQTTKDEIDEKDILDALHNKVVVIDDFHRLSYKAQVEVLAYIRSLTNQLATPNPNMDFRFIIVYIPYKLTDRSLNDNELSPRRVEHLPIPLWSERELEDIARVTFRQNDFCLTNAGSLAKHAFGLPALMQQFCLDYCREYQSNVRPTTVIAIKDHLVPAILVKFANLMWDSYGGDDFYASITAVQARTFPERGQMIKSRIDQREGTIYQMIWYVLALSHSDNNVGSITPVSSNFEIPLSMIQNRLRQFTDASQEVIDEVERYLEKISEHSNLRYQEKIEESLGYKADLGHERRSILDPLFEYKPDSYGVNSRLIINNPEFLFTLAHAEAHKHKFK